MRRKMEQNPDCGDIDIESIEKKYLEVSKKLALIKKRFDILEKQHWNLRRELERAKGFPMRSKYDTIKCVGEEFILLYYRGELVIKHDLDELVEYYFKNMFTRVCPEEM